MFGVTACRITKGKQPISVAEYQRISVSRFNTRELMDRFEQIGDEVMEENEQQYATDKVWSVEYAKLHQAEFEPIRSAS